MSTNSRYSPEPLCGWKWYDKHKQDYTQEYIESLTIEVSVPGSKLRIRNIAKSKGIISETIGGKGNGDYE